MNDSIVNAEYFELDLFALAKAMWKRAWLFILCGVLCACAAFSLARVLMTPTYMSFAMM